MKTVVPGSAPSSVAPPMARLAIAAAAATLLLLASLHVLSPEFDPAWRMVSEYANGRSGWVLSLFFAAWGVSSWALAAALWPEAGTTPRKLGLLALILAGGGQALAAGFDLNHDAMHALAGALGMLGLPSAAMLLGVPLGRAAPSAAAERTLLWTAHLTWIGVVLLGATLVLLAATYQAAAGALPAEAPAALPPGVIGLVGWANRFLVVVDCAWTIAVARQVITVHGEASARGERTAAAPAPTAG